MNGCKVILCGNERTEVAQCSGASGRHRVHRTASFEGRYMDAIDTLNYYDAEAASDWMRRNPDLLVWMPTDETNGA